MNKCGHKKEHEKNNQRTTPRHPVVSFRHPGSESRVPLITFFMFFFMTTIFHGTAQAQQRGRTAPAKRTVVIENQTIDFEGLSLEGELKAPSEFYFQNRNQERFDTLTKRRLNFRREMLRDSIQSN